jgi:hypothetical protein
MLLPAIHGLIRRRILVNFRVDPVVMQRLLPEPFRPVLVDGAALAGICLIRLEQVRCRPLPSWLGMSSENAAHRVAVRWLTADGQERQGVYIPRRDSGSVLNHLAGGRLFPGEHHRAAFSVVDREGAIGVSMRSLDGEVSVELQGRPCADLPNTSKFAGLQAASEFFERGAIGYSEKAQHYRLDGLRLVTKEWRVEPLTVDHVQSSFFSDRALFPRGSVEFDCALLMRDVEHEWQRLPDLLVEAHVLEKRAGHWPTIGLS